MTSKSPKLSVQLNPTDAPHSASASLSQVPFIDNEEFPFMDEENVINNFYCDTYKKTSDANATPGTNPQNSTHPLLTAAGEQHLFRKMNFLKYKANHLAATIHKKQPNRSMRQEFHTLLEQAAATRNTIIEANTRLVASIAHKFANSRIEFEELVSEGNMILLNAVDRFDYSRGFRFSTYATHSIQRHFCRLSQRRQRRKKQEITTPSDILAETVPNAEQDQPLDRAIAEALLQRFSDCLDDREEVIIRERFGFNRRQTSATLKVVADKVGLSKERVRQLQQTAIEKLQDLAIQLNLKLEPSL